MPESIVILLADDDPDDADIFMDIWKDVDPSCVVHTFSSGGEMLEYFNEAGHAKPTLIFLDINMPQMNGWQCLTAIKSNPSLIDIPVLMYSTSSHLRDKEIAAELGAMGFITKPSDYKSLQKVIHIISANVRLNLRDAIQRLL